MYKILSSSAENFVAIKFSEKVTKEDYNELIPVIENKLLHSKKINLYWEFENFHGWDASSLFKEVKFDLKYAGKFDRIAIVGESMWQHALSSIANYVTPAQVKYFPKEKQLDAMNWVKSSDLETGQEVYKNSSLID